MVSPISLSQWLQENGYGQGRVAVERNGEIIPKSQYDTVILREGDCLEIVHFDGRWLILLESEILWLQKKYYKKP